MLTKLFLGYFEAIYCKSMDYVHTMFLIN